MKRKINNDLEKMVVHDNKLCPTASVLHCVPCLIMDTNLDTLVRPLFKGTSDCTVSKLFV